MQLQDFLRVILPEQGTKCWVTINKKRVVKQFFTDNISSLVAEIESASLVDGLDIYHACASFKDASARTKTNAAFARALWADIDCGPGKPYKDFEDGLQAVDNFANRLGVALPLAICSGKGLHVYWPFTRDIPAEQWIAAATLLKHRAEALGLHADPARTADISSILRPVGTANYKRDKEPVVAIEGDLEFSVFEDFYAALQKEVTTPATSPLNPPTYLATGVGSVSGAILAGGPKLPPDMTRGYPDGERTRALQERAGHLLAKGWSYEQTLAACRVWNQHNTPPLPDDKLIHDIGSYSKREEDKHTVVTPEEKSEWPAPPLPYFYDTHYRLKCRIKDEEGKEKEAIVSPYPLQMLAVCRRESEAKFAYSFRYKHPHNGEHIFTIPARDMHSSRCGEIMAENGAVVDMSLFKGYVKLMDTTFKGAVMDARQFEQFGWKDDDKAFLIGNSLIKTGGQAEYAYGDVALTSRMPHMKLLANTSLAAWRSEANKCFGAGYQAHGFALLTAFAAPLMHFACGQTDGGAILALYSKGSGRGKTAILEAITSVWGKFDGFSTAMMDTENAKFGIISRLCHLPFIEEEMSQKDPSIAAAFIKRFTTGRDKNRSQRDGSVILRDTRYQTIGIMASNKSLYEILKQSDDDGAVARVFELNIDYPDDESFKSFRRVSANMMAHCGHAGRTFIYGLMQPGVLEWAKNRIDEEIKKYITLLETRPEHRYIVWLMATNHVAGILANKFGILDFDVDRIMDWAVKQAFTRVQDVSDVKAPALLNRFINENFEHCLVVSERFNAQRTQIPLRLPRGEMTMRLELQPQRLYVSTDALRAWLAKVNRSYIHVMKELKEQNIILNSQCLKVLAAGTDIPSGRVSTWEVDMAHPDIGGYLREVNTAENMETNAAVANAR